MSKDIANYIVNEDLNLELFLCTEVLKLNSLHYGFWEQEVPLTMENLKAAQKRYTEKIIEKIPKGVQTILDVGCGIGDVAKALNEHGYKVTAISPDKNHGKFFEQNGTSEITFHQKKFEELNIQEEFDLILMSESQNYFDPQIGFQQCKRYLKSTGKLLICGPFQKERNAHFEKIRNIESEYIHLAKQSGFVLNNRIDITANVAPTLKFAGEKYREYISPFLSMMGHYIKGSSAFKLNLVKWFFRKEIERSNIIQKYYLEYFNPEEYLKHVCYAMHMYSRSQV